MNYKGFFKSPVDGFGAGFFNVHVVSALQTQNRLKTVNNSLVKVFMWVNR
jgi:hypothetical protein